MVEHRHCGVRAPAAILQHVGSQLRSSRLQDRLTVGEAVAPYTSFYDRPADPDHLLDVVGLTGARRTRYARLSCGRQQRLSIALALAGTPQLVVFDEITTGLNPKARRDTSALIERIRARGVTVVLVTHVMEEAQRLCDHVAVIAAGRGLAVDTPAGLIARARGAVRVRVRAAEPLDPAVLRDVANVTAVTADGEGVVVTGSGDDVVPALMRRLLDNRVAVTELRVGLATLDDAYLALTDQTPDRSTV